MVENAHQFGDMSLTVDDSPYWRHFAEMVPESEIESATWCLQGNCVTY